MRAEGYLLSVSIGPVQDFIAAARRTGDLWAGSRLIVEIAKACALELHRGESAELIFPGIAQSADLEPGSAFSMPNHVLAILPAGADPEASAKRARQAAQRRWLDVAERVYREWRTSIDEELWERQVSEALEFYAAWVPLTSDYRQARRRVEGILAGRKALRDFQPYLGKPGVPKSSLDGARESVLRPDACREELARWLKQGEELDAIGLVKRRMGLEGAFPPVSRVALDPWVRAMSARPRDLERLTELGLALTATTRVGACVYRDFPVDGEFVFVSRHRRLEAEDEAPQRAAAVLEEIRSLLQSLPAALREPAPYLAVLKADGDRMGAMLDELTSAEAHKAVSAKLSGFARQVDTMVRDHRGGLVYCGGDDVLALVPVDKVLGLADRLRRAFADSMGKLPTDQAPTLSVGVAIGHYLEPLSDLLEWAERALRKAKEQGRNALCLAYHARSGADPLVLCRSWTEDPYARLTGWIARLEDGALSARTAFDLSRLAREYRDGRFSAQAELLRGEVRRLLRRKESGVGPLPEELCDEVVAVVKDLESLHALAQELLLARHLSRLTLSGCTGAGGEDG